MRATTYFAGAIGGASEITLLAEAHGARTDLVAAAHSLRVLIVTVTIPFAMQWSGLHGLESDVPPPNPPASISHSHVLAQEMRTPAKAKAVARRLIVKCGARLRRMGQTGASVSLHLDMGPKGTPRSGRRGWETAGLHCAVAPTQDTFALLTALDSLWRKVEPELEAGRLSLSLIHISEPTRPY